MNFSDTESTGETREVTRFLADWRAGRPDALEQMLPLVIGELRLIARQSARNRVTSRISPVDSVSLKFIPSKILHPA